MESTSGTYVLKSKSRRELDRWEKDRIRGRLLRQACACLVTNDCIRVSHCIIGANRRDESLLGLQYYKRNCFRCHWFSNLSVTLFPFWFYCSSRPLSLLFAGSFMIPCPPTGAAQTNPVPHRSRCLSSSSKGVDKLAR
jgi:hypothetical protein